MQGVRQVGNALFYGGGLSPTSVRLFQLILRAMFQAKYDYKPVKMEFGWKRKALDACMVGDLAKLNSLSRIEAKLVIV